MKLFLTNRKQDSLLQESFSTTSFIKVLKLRVNLLATILFLFSTCISLGQVLLPDNKTANIKVEVTRIAGTVDDGIFSGDPEIRLFPRVTFSPGVTYSGACDPTLNGVSIPYFPSPFIPVADLNINPGQQLPTSLTLRFDAHEDDSSPGNCVFNSGDDHLCNNQTQTVDISSYVMNNDDGIINIPMVRCSGVWIIDFRITIDFQIINDICSQALPITCGETLSGNTLNATSAGAVAPCQGPNGSGTVNFGLGVWYTFFGTGDTMILSTDHAMTDFNTELQLWSGSCGSLTCIGGDDDGGANLTSTLKFKSADNQRYYVYVDGNGSSRGNYELSLSCPPPPNDNCATAISLPALTSSCVLNDANTSHANGSGTYPLCDNFDNIDLWYSFQAPASGAVQIEKIDGAANPDLEVAIWNDCAGNAGDEIYCSGILVSGQRIFGLNPDSTYYLQLYIDGFKSQGDFQFCLKASPPIPPNDTCGSAFDYETIFGPISDISSPLVNIDSSDMTFYFDNGIDPTCDFGNDATSWYTWTATHSAVFFDSQLGEPGLEILQGNCDSLTSLGCLNNVDGSIAGLEIGEDYLFLIWDDTAPGASQVSWTIEGFNTLANDTCSSVLDYNTEFGPISSYGECPGEIDSLDMKLYSQGMINPTCETFSSVTSWYSWTATDTSLYFESLAGSPGLEVFSGTCDNLISHGCLDNNSGTINGLIVGVTYKFLIWNSFSSNTTVQWKLTAGPKRLLNCGDVLDYPPCDVDYDNNDDQTFIICPIPGQQASITFTHFDLETCCDFVEIFDDGISLGAFSGTSLLDSTFTSSDTGQCLEVVFTTDHSVTRAGITFVVNCYNDICEGVQNYEHVFGPIGPEGSCPGTPPILDFSSYTDGGYSATCDGSLDANAWYVWTATHRIVEFTSLLGAPGIEILEGSCGNFVSIGCLNNVSGVIDNLTIGTEYIIVIWDDNIPGASQVSWCLEGYDCTSTEVTTTANDGPGSLRRIVSCATDGDVSTFSPLINGDSIKLNSTITVDKNVTIKGNGAENTIIDGTNFANGRLISVFSGDTVNFIGMTFQHGGGPTYSGGGAGLFVNGKVKIASCIFHHNEAGSDGGALSVEGLFGSCQITNSLLYENKARDDAGAIRIGFGADVSVINSTIVNNNSANLAGGIFVISPTDKLNLFNSIVAGNQATFGPDLYILNLNATLDFQHNILSDTVGLGAHPGLMVGFPTFVDTALYDFHLQDTSIGIDNGLATLLPIDECDVDDDGNSLEMIDVDLDGNPRIAICELDLGAYENQLFPFCPPVNDICDGAIAISCGDIVIDSTINATTLDAQPACSGNVGSGGISAGIGVWYKFLGTGEIIAISTNHPSTDFDTELQLFSGACGSLICIGGDDDSGDDTGGVFLSSKIEFASEINTDYFVYVDGNFTSSTGNFGLTINCTSCPVPSGLIVQEQVPFGALISWTNGDSLISNSIVRLCPEDSSFENSACIEFHTNSAVDSLMLNGLPSCSDFDVYVYQECANSDSSFVIGPETFRTYTTDTVNTNPQCADTVNYPVCLRDFYNLDETITFTICPSGMDTASITFTYFDIEVDPFGGGTTSAGCWDYVEVFDDGLSLGTYCSEASRSGSAPSDPASDLSIHNTFVASDTGHCLVVEFISDEFEVSTGFQFIVNNCTDCPPVRVINGMPEAGIYYAGNSINSDATIESPKGIIFQAGDEIILNPNFEVQLGAEFAAQIDDCP